MSALPTPWNRARVFACVCLLLGAAVLLASAPDRAHARVGIGNPLKKAKEKLAKSSEPKDEGEIDNDTIIFDDVTLELTESRVAAIVAAFKATKAQRAEREAAVQRLNKASDARAAYDDKHGEAIRELQAKRDEIEVCYADGYNEAKDRRGREYAQHALTDPAIRDKFAKAAAQYNAAAAKGDSTAIAKLNSIMAAEVSATHEDSVAVRKQCGPLPPPSPAEIQLAALDKDVAAKTEELRAIDKKAAEAHARETDMNPEQYAMALERIQAYVSWADSKKKGPRGYTPEEIAILESHLADLREGIRY